MAELPIPCNNEAPVPRTKKPDWLRVKLPIGESYKHVRNLVDTHKLHTICESGNCPNMGECWGAGTATFMILGNVCTPETTLETLIPDFKGKKEDIQRVMEAAPEVISHNIETVERLTRQVRIQAKYWRSMEVIRTLKAGGRRTKSGIMLGLGEKKEEVIQTIKDLRDNGCDVITIGQYLQPTPKHLAVHRFVHPDEFAEYREIGYAEGLDYVESGPLVRSSYHSERHVFPGLGRKEWEMKKLNSLAL
jgi:lipoate synthase